MKEFMVALAQIDICSGSLEKNFDKIASTIDNHCKKFRVDFVVFPESITTGFNISGNLKRIYINLKSKLKRQIEKIQQVVYKNKIYLILPTYEPARQKFKFYNTAFVFNPDGKSLGKYCKNFPFPTEYWTIPSDEIEIFKSCFCNFGIMLCYDGDFPELARKYALKGIDVIFRPSAFLRRYEIWSLTNRARAYDNQVYICAVNSTGSDTSGRSYYGHSMVVNPYGKIIKEAAKTAQVVNCKIVSKNKVTVDDIRVNHLESLRKKYAIRNF
ncbi:MAG: carbon-nitrogen hydrolase family protein [Elusimicrobiota bacterium]|nr:carbon-nitrogen hydrolase family protein [Elusimicrobiota bacterium]